MAENVFKRLTYLIEAQDKTQKSFENFRHRIAKTELAYKELRKEGGKQLEQLGRTGAVQNVMNEKELLAQKVSAENKKHQLSLDKMRTNQQQRLTHQTHRFKMEYLGIMFAGMQVQRVMGRYLRSMFTAFNSVFEETSALEKQTNRISAAWQFFQFRLMEALTQSSLFRNIVDILVNVIDSFARLDKEVRMGIVATIAAAFVAGGAFFLIGQSALAWNSMKMAWAAGSGPVSMFGPGSNARKQLTSFTSLMTKLLGGVLIAWSVKNIFEDITGKSFEGVFDNIVNAAMLAFGMKLLFKTAFGPVFLWTFVVNTAFEIVVDPRGFGTWVVAVSNQVLLAVEAIGKVIRAALFTIADMFKGDFGMGRFGEVSYWLKDFYSSSEEEILKLQKEGKLSDTLAIAWSEQIAAAMAAITVSPYEEQLGYYLEQTQNKLASMETTAQGFSSAIDTAIGTNDTPGKAITSFNDLNEDINVVGEDFVNNVQTPIDDWTPPDKHVYIYYHYIGSREEDERESQGFSSAYDQGV